MFRERWVVVIIDACRSEKFTASDEPENAAKMSFKLRMPRVSDAGKAAFGFSDTSAGGLLSGIFFCCSTSGGFIGFAGFEMVWSFLFRSSSSLSHRDMTLRVLLPKAGVSTIADGFFEPTSGSDRLLEDSSTWDCC